MADRDPESAKKSRQKIIIVVSIIVGGFFAWQVFGMFSGSAEEEQAKMAAAAPPPPPMPTPKPTELPKVAAPMTQREMELMQLQQETEAKYLSAVNELQMLKIQRDIAETNRAIAGAKLETVNAQKAIVTVLTPEVNTDYAQRLTNPTQGAPINSGGGTNTNQPIGLVETAYTVISVSEIQGTWGAVIGASGKLYNVRVGDVLPTDQSKVISINRSGVVLEKDGVKKTISLVPII